jgi:TPR repeat protein
LGNADGQYKLGELYAKGEGVPRDIKEAYYWLQLSTNHGNKDYIATRDEIGTQLTSQDIEEIKQRTRQWRPTYNPEKPN